MKFAIPVAVIVVAVVLMALTIANEGCLPWQERVGVRDGLFGSQETITRCDGSWFPFGSSLLLGD